MNATKRPWHTKELHPNYGGHVLLYSNGNGLQRVDDKQGRFSSADAAYIVRAVNSFDAMRELINQNDDLLAELSQYVSNEHIRLIAEQRKRNNDTLDRIEEGEINQ